MTLIQEKGFLGNQLGQGQRHPVRTVWSKEGSEESQGATHRVRVLGLGAKEPDIVLRMKSGRDVIGVCQGRSFSVPEDSMEKAPREQGWEARWL